jgi:Amidohydrolase family
MSCQAQSDTFDIVIKNISIIDTKQKAVFRNRIVYIKGDRIVKIEKRKKRKKIVADTIINGQGRFMIAGFWDLDETLFPILLSYGITGVRDMGGSLQILNAFKKKAHKNPASCPTIIGAGPILDGENPVHPDFSIPLTSTNVKSVLDSLYNNGVDFFKVYSLLSQSLIDSVAAYSNKIKLPFAGHISEYITPEEAVTFGQKSLEHLNRLEDLENDTSRLAKFMLLTKSHKTWICPTLIVYKRKNEIRNEHFEDHTLYESLDVDLKKEWEEVKIKRKNKQLNHEEIVSANNRFENQKKLVKTFYDNKIPFLLGSDFAGMQFVYPGYSFHEEMALLGSIGIPNMDILQMATYNATEFLGITELYGTIEVTILHKVFSPLDK